MLSLFPLSLSVWSQFLSLPMCVACYFIFIMAKAFKHDIQIADNTMDQRSRIGEWLDDQGMKMMLALKIMARTSGMMMMPLTTFESQERILETASSSLDTHWKRVVVVKERMMCWWWWWCNSIGYSKGVIIFVYIMAVHNRESEREREDIRGFDLPFQCQCDYWSF